MEEEEVDGGADPGSREEPEVARDFIEAVECCSGVFALTTCAACKYTELCVFEVRES